MSGVLRLPKRAAAFACGACLLAAAPALADQIFAEDVIVQGRACIGLDCVNNEEFGDSTMILKENNLRIGFDDRTDPSATPTAADWELTANDSANEGASWLGVTQPLEAATTPLRVLAGSPTEALVVDQRGIPVLNAGLALQRNDATSGEAFEEVDVAAVLNGVARVSMFRFAQPAGSSVGHVGPSGSQFNGELGLGSGSAVAVTDAAGVALAVLKDSAPKAAAASPGGRGPAGHAGPAGPPGPDGAVGPPAPRPGADHNPSRAALKKLNRRLKRMSRAQRKLDRSQRKLGRRIAKIKRAAN